MEPPPKRPKRATTTLSSTHLFNPDSPITKSNTDIQTFLSICLLKWIEYNEDEKKTIISTLPPAYQIFSYDTEKKLKCPITPDFLVSDIIIRDQIARFKRDVEDGYYTKTWQEKARKAMKERAGGKFDEYLAKHAEELFVTNEDENVPDEVGAVSSDGEYGIKVKGKQSKGASSKNSREKGPRATSKLEAAMAVEGGYEEIQELSQR